MSSIIEDINTIAKGTANHDKLVELFSRELRSMFNFFISLNEFYMSESDGRAAISPLILTAAVMTVSQLQPDAIATIMDRCLEYATEHPHIIETCDSRSAVLPELATQLFPAHADMLKGLIATFNDGVIPDESISDVFEFVRNLTKFAATWKCVAYAKQGNCDGVDAEKFRRLLKTVKLVT